MTSAISWTLWSSVYECQRLYCALTSPVRTECGMFVLYAVLYASVNCFVVRGCAVLKRYINVCNSCVFRGVNMYLNHLKFYVVCINGRMYVCCSELYVVSNECDEPTTCLVEPIDTHGVELCILGAILVNLVSWIMATSECVL